MPKIDASILNALIAAFAARDSICVPVHQGKTGNPILWGAAYFPEMMQLTGDSGAKQLLAKHRDSIIEVPIASDRIFTDIDTPDDLERLLAVMPAKAGIQ